MAMLEKLHAEACAHNILKFWERLGYSNVRVWAEPRMLNGEPLSKAIEPAYWTVCSNLRGGLPVGFRATKEEVQKLNSAFNSQLI